jgi:rRNA small subunit pseudouridine methyltransferase Nep1
MMRLVLAEASLELVPPEIRSHPAIIADARRRGRRPEEMLLDRARHHPAMLALKDSLRRGRPDIVHQALLVFQYSLLNRRGLGRAYVHTRDDYVIVIQPETRMPRNYNNFIALIEQLYAIGRVPPRGKPLIELQRKALQSLLRELGNRWIVLHENGVKVSLAEIGKALLSSVVVIGGFPHGDFLNKWVIEAAEAVYRLGDEVMDAAQVICKAVTAAETAAGLL